MLNRKLSMLLVVVMLFSLLPQHLLSSAYAASPGARAAMNPDGELFLGGNYMELGISKWGDFGTLGNKPSNFIGTTVRNNIGMSVAHNGFGTPGAKTMDYYLPGSPEERFAVGYKIGSNTYNNSNSALNSARNMPTIVTNESSIVDGKLQAKIVSTWTDTMEITQVVSFSEDDKIFKNEVTIKNISNQTWDNARYMRSLDPDNSVDIGGSYSTENSITHTIQEDGIALVKAEASGADKYPLFFYSTDPKAKGSIFGFSNSNPYQNEAYDAAPAKNTKINGDIAIAMTWESHSSVAPGGSETFIYYTSLDNRDPNDIIVDIGVPSNDFLEVEDNDGAVIGTSKVAMKGGRLQDTIDPAFLTINNLPDGLSLGTVTRVSDTLLEFTIVGKALKHESYHSVENASLTIGVENILVGVKTFTSEPFKITFMDQTKAYIKSSTVTETVYGTGEVAGRITVSITDGYLKDTVTDSDIIINQLPTGVTYTVTRVSDHELVIDVAGTTVELQDVMNASITINGGVLVGSQGQAITSNTFYINFEDETPFLFVENPILKESIANDGTISEPIKLKLSHASFKDRSVIDAVYTINEAIYGINLPAGIEIDNYIIHSPNELTITLKGAAIHATSAHNITHAQFAINSDIVELSPATVYSAPTINSNTVSFYFMDDAPIIKVLNNLIVVEPDYTIPTKLVVESKHGAFDSSLTAADIKVNNLPAGINISNLTVLNANTIELTFNVGSAEQFALDATAAFASITIPAGKVIGSIEDLTTNTFKFDVRKPDDITWEAIKNENELMTDVSFKLNLIKEVTESRVVWTSSNPSVIDLNGAVTPSLLADQSVTLTAAFKKDGVNVTRVFNIVVPMIQLQLKEVEVFEANPSEVKLTFNLPLAILETDDFSGLTIDGRKVTGVVSITDREAIVTLESPLAATSKLVVLYDQAEGNVVGNNAASSELVTITAADQTAITVKNSIEPLQVVASYMKNGKLKVIFNKEIDEDNIDLTGLKLGDMQLSGSHIVNGHELVIDVPHTASSLLTYTGGNIQEKSNHNNKVAFPVSGIDLGASKSYIDSKGQLTSLISFKHENNAMINMTPSFNANTAAIYVGRVGHYTKVIHMTAPPTTVPGTFAKAYVNGTEIDLTTLAIPLDQLNNTIVIKLFDVQNPKALLGQYEFDIVVDGLDYSTTPGQHIVGSIVKGDKGSQPISLTSTRTNQGDKIVENVVLTGEHTRAAFAQDAQGANKKLVINIPNQDSVAELKTVVEKSAFSTLASHDVDIEIYGKGAAVKIKGTSLSNLETDMYVRFIPVSDTTKQEQYNKQVKQLANHNKIELVGQPMQLDTNLADESFKVFLPIDAADIPKDEKERVNYLKRLGIYAAYSNGTEGLVAGTLVTDVNGKLGLEFTVTRGGTFSIAEATSQADQYIVGYPDGEFKPEEAVSRGQIALMFARNLSYDKDEQLSGSSYKDLPINHFASTAIEFITQMKIMNGYADGSFRANNFMTRAEMISLAVRYQGYEVDKAGALTFADTAGHWAQYMIEAARQNGLIDETEDFRPDEELTRLEAVMIINRLFNRTPLTEVTKPTFTDVSASHPAFGHIEEAVRAYNHIFISTNE